MTYKIAITRKFDKKFSSLSKEMQLRVIEKIRILETKPDIGKPLKGKFKGLLSLRIGDYRMIYRIDKKKTVIYIIAINHRKSAYR